ncbi:MAG TPA: hypothetical protein DCL74_03930, partial [Succinivibrionaceae bacterium]|nr:hypothetical protein [Succinivibrionaceae bacterium]
MEDIDFAQLLNEADHEGQLDFAQAAGPVKRIHQDKIETSSTLLDPALAKARQQAAVKLPEKLTETASSSFVQMVAPQVILEYRRPGVQPYIVKKLRNGEYCEADFIDLHGLTVEQAYEKVMRFIAYAKEREYRCILIIHGKGQMQKQKALIKSFTAHWLKQIPEILA